MVLCLIYLHTQVLHMLTIHFGCSLNIPTIIYIFDMLLMNLCRGALRYQGESVMLCAWEPQFPTLQRVDDSILFGVSAPSEGICSA